MFEWNSLINIKYAEKKPYYNTYNKRQDRIKLFVVSKGSEKSRFQRILKSIFHVCVAFRLGVWNHSSLDQAILHLLQFISTSTSILVIHVSHAFKGGKLQSVRVSEGSSSGSKCSIVSNLNVFDMTIQDSDVMAGSAKLLVEHSEWCKHLIVADDFHFGSSNRIEQCWIER